MMFVLILKVIKINYVKDIYLFTSVATINIIKE